MSGGQFKEGGGGGRGRGRGEGGGGETSSPVTQQRD